MEEKTNETMVENEPEETKPEKEKVGFFVKVGRSLKGLGEKVEKADAKTAAKKIGKGLLTGGLGAAAGIGLLSLVRGSGGYDGEPSYLEGGYPDDVIDVVPTEVSSEVPEE